MNKIGLALALIVACPAIAQAPRTTIDGSADLREQASSPVARANYGRLFTKVSDSGLYYLSDNGAETNLLTGGASAAAILASLLTVDGAGSLLDADFLDGVSGDGYCLVTGANVFTGNISFEGSIADAFETTFVITNPTADRNITFKDGAGTVAFLSDITNMSAADILAALITVDGAGSLLDADFLDGQSSAAFAIVAGGNTFAASNTYAANDIVDADVVDTITASNYLPLAGGTLTGDLIFEGITADLFEMTVTAADPTADVTLTIPATTQTLCGSAGGCAFAAGNTYAANDITDADVVDTITASNYCALAGCSMVGDLTTSTDVNVNGNDITCAGPTCSVYGTATTINIGAGATTVNINGGSASTGATFTDGSFTAANFNSTANADFQGVIRNTAGTYIEVDDSGMRTTGAFAVVTQGNGNINLAPMNTTRFVVYNAGLYGIPSTAQQAITIATGTDTTTPTSSHVELSCTTAPCTYSPGETSAIDGWIASVCNVDATDNIDLASAAGTVRVRLSPLTLIPDECASCIYTGLIWACQGDKT